MPENTDFYNLIPLEHLNEEQWEALCDRCGLCCYRKYITGRGKNEKTHFTRIACDLLDLNTGRCTDYENRFKKQKECTHLTKKNAGMFNWLPETCAYRLRHENKPLPEWHPLVSGRQESLYEAGIMIKNGVHECEVNEEEWEEYEI